MTLHAVTFGSVSHDASDVVLVHGFTQTHGSWVPIITELSGETNFIAIDAPGHGLSGDGRQTLPECGDAIAAASPENSILVGYSMGARMALHSVLQHPDHFKALVLVSGTAGIENQSEREARVASDNALADRIELIGVEAFIDEWLANPMFKGLSTEMAMRRERLTNSALGLANSLRYAGTGTQVPLWDQLENLAIPTLVITGDLDSKFTDIGDRMATTIPHATRSRMAGVGHTCHLENHAEFSRILSNFIALNEAR